MGTNLVEGRNKLHAQCEQIVQASAVAANSDALKFLPLYIMGMLKSQAFRATNDIGADLRSYIWMRLGTLTVPQVAAFYYPRMMALHNIPDNIDDDGQIQVPAMLNLTSKSMAQDGIYLLEDGETMLMWIGRAGPGEGLQALFGSPSFDQLDTFQIETQLMQGQDQQSKVGRVLARVQTERAVPYMQLKIIRCGDAMEPRFFASLIEDRTAGLMSSYSEFLHQKGYRPQTQRAVPLHGQQLGRQ